jgi:hypothetical protein
VQHPTQPTARHRSKLALLIPVLSTLVVISFSPGVQAETRCVDEKLIFSLSMEELTHLAVFIDEIAFETQEPACQPETRPDREASTQPTTEFTSSTGFDRWLAGPHTFLKNGPCGLAHLVM